MFKIDRASNSVTSLTTRTFEELAFKERANLQEWIAKEPSCLGEEFLIIQKEFSGFSDTHERLDILALDKQGSLVLIENKLDDTGRDVTWQALKYASYCSRLSKENVRSIYQEFLAKTDPSADARGLITEFLEADDYEEVAVNKGFTQRIILIAANFRKEVTSTVLWLLNFKLRIQCFLVTRIQWAKNTF
jgi:RecB family endonuclease NucS